MMPTNTHRDEEMGLPMVSLAGREWDLSNLCVDRKMAPQEARPAEFERYCPSLYPEEDIFIENDLSVDQVFAQAARKSVRQQLLRRETRRQSQNPLKPPPAKAVEKAELLDAHYDLIRRKQEYPPKQLDDSYAGTLDITETTYEDSSLESYTQLQRGRLPNACNYHHSKSNWSEPSSSFDSYNDQLPQPPIEIEVTPGQFLPLRGSVETLAAIESGRASLVTCLSCRARLSCVPDCQVVICPDCRFLSPVEDVKYHQSLPDMDWWYEDSQQRPQFGRRASLPLTRKGVGLGLKM